MRSLGVEPDLDDEIQGFEGNGAIAFPIRFRVKVIASESKVSTIQRMISSLVV
jgi:hypothetical protein